MNDSVIAAAGLGIALGGKQVLDGLDLEVPRGSIVGLVGRNGAGKTTLIRCLLGLARPDAGGSALLAEPSWDLPDAAKERLGYVAQKPDHPPWLSVRDCCAYVGSFYRSWDAARVASLVERWELDPKQRVGRLSVGQQQALAVILALGHAPELLILDEPASALDPVARRRFLQTIAGEVAGGATVLFSTHLTADLERVADRIAILAHGRIVVHDGIDALRARVRRLRCPPLPGVDPATWPGVVGCEHTADGVVLLVDGTADDIAARVAAATGTAPAVDAPALDDIVIGYER